MSRAYLIDPEKNTRNLYKSVVVVNPSKSRLKFSYNNPTVTVQDNIPSFEPTLGVSDLTNAELIYIHTTTTTSEAISITSTVGSTSKIQFNPTFPGGWNIALMCQIVFKPQHNPDIAYSTSIGSMQGSTSGTLTTELYFEDSKQLGQQYLNVSISMWGFGVRISMN